MKERNRKKRERENEHAHAERQRREREKERGGGERGEEEGVKKNKMSSFHREEILLGKRKPSPLVGKFEEGTRGCWENLEGGSALIYLIP